MTGFNDYDYKIQKVFLVWLNSIQTYSLKRT